MSRLVERALRRQRAIQYSRSTALMGLVGALVVAILALISIVVSIAGGAVVSPGVLAGGIILIVAGWVAGHLSTEIRRLGKLLKNRDLILRSEQNPELTNSGHWKSLNPFAGWRDRP